MAGNMECEDFSHFKKSEIVGYTYIDGRKVTVLKMGVKRKHYNDNIDPEVLESHFNQELKNLEKWEWYHKVILGEDDFEN
jgi:hypothetical protein